MSVAGGRSCQEYFRRESWAYTRFTDSNNRDIVQKLIDLNIEMELYEDVKKDLLEVHLDFDIWCSHPQVKATMLELVERRNGPIDGEYYMALRRAENNMH